MFFTADSRREPENGSISAEGHSRCKGRFREGISSFPRLLERKEQSAGTLSGGEQQMLAIGRAMMARPKMILLDEPSLGLGADSWCRACFDIIREINKQGVTILLVEQNAQMALSVADRGYVLETGKIVKSAPAKELLNDASVKAAYLGG